MPKVTFGRNFRRFRAEEVEAIASNWRAKYSRYDDAELQKAMEATVTPSPSNPRRRDSRSYDRNRRRRALFERVDGPGPRQATARALSSPRSVGAHRAGAVYPESQNVGKSGDLRRKVILQNSSAPAPADRAGELEPPN
jgi:hypothetical protein